MGHPEDEEIEVCSNKVPGVLNGFDLSGHRLIYVYIANTLKIFS